MRLRVSHQTTYRYASPANTITQILRMRPRGHEGQFVVDWRIELDRDARLQVATDAFGNIVHSFTLAGPLAELTISAIGDVETEDTHGVIRQQLERFPASIFLRETHLTRSDSALRAFAEEAAGNHVAEPLSRLHDLNAAVFEKLRFNAGGTDAATTAAEAFKAGHGVCQDYAHVFISAARHLSFPARYVGGYLHREGVALQEAGHGWAEAYVADLGWVAFDPANGISATADYLRVAVGLDYLGAAPIRGARLGGGDETMSVAIRVDDVGVAIA